MKSRKIEIKVKKSSYLVAIHLLKVALNTKNQIKSMVVKAFPL
jgi:hypothetical protein